MPGRESLRITFPKLDGYRLEVPTRSSTSPTSSSRSTSAPARCRRGPSPLLSSAQPELDGRTRSRRSGREPSPTSSPSASSQHHFATRRRHRRVRGQVRARPWLFPRVVELCTEWIDRAVTVEDGWHLGHLAKYAQWQARACDAVYAADHVLRQGDRGR
jgi:type III restriction enzyme